MRDRDKYKVLAEKDQQLWPTISCKIVEPLRKNKVFWPPSPHCNVDWKQM